MEKMKKSWWKVPLYCLAASWIRFQLTIRLGRLVLVTLPDGSVSADETRWMLISGVLFALTIALGGLVFFRKMTRRELLRSAAVMAALNAVCGLTAYYIQGMFALYWSELTEWDIFVAQLLFDLGLNQWVSAAVLWLLPFVFVLFGRKDTET